MNILKRLSIRAKLGLLLVLSAASLVVALALAGGFVHQRMMDDRIFTLRSAVETAHGLAASLEAQVQQGKFSRDEAIDRLRTALHAMRFDHGDGYFTVSRFDGVSLIHGANPKQEGTQRLGIFDSHGNQITADLIRVAKSPKGEGITTYYFPKPGQTEALPKTTYVKAFLPWDVLIAVGAYTDDIEADFRADMLQLGLAALAIIAVVGFIAFLINRNITGALGSLTAKMQKLAAGNLEVEITEAAQGDEVGAMGRSVQVFKDNAIENQRLQEAQRVAEAEQRRRDEAERQAEAERRQETAARERQAEADKRRLDDEQREQQAAAERRATETRKREMLALADSFEASISGVVQTVSSAATEMQATAGSMSNTAGQTNARAAAVAAASEEASTNVQTVASAAEELSSSIHEIARQVAESTRVAAQAVAEADKTNATVKGLAEAAQKIGQVVQLIHAIASQTNLLALNATIEAARAGEAGKGFAVVASEVKSLANQTAKATEEISSQISGMQQVSSDAVKAIAGIGATIGKINEIATVIATSIEEQGSATQEIARNVQQAAAGTQDVSSNIDGVTQAANDTGAAAKQVLGSATELSEQSKRLRSEVDGFIAKIRAA